MVREHVARGFLRPSLAAQIEERIEDAALLAPAHLQADRDWIAPSGVRPREDERRWACALRACAARARDVYARSPFPEAIERLRARLG
jgi:hypothetical protein